MSTGYNTNAKPRGRREDEVERQSSSRTSSHASSRPSKVTSRASYDDTPIPRSNRPDSPALFWQRNKAVDPSRPADSIVMSPKSSNASVTKFPPPPPQEVPEDKTPTPSSPTKSVKSLGSKRSVESARGSNASVGFGMDNPDSRGSTASSNVSSASRGKSTKSEDETRQPSRPSGLSQSAVSQMQPKVTDPAEEESSSQVSRQSRGSAQSTRSLEPGDKRASQIPPDPPFEHPSQAYQPPSTTTPVISPPQSPKMMYHGNYGGPQPQYPPYPYPQPMPPNFYPQPPFSPPTSIPQMESFRSPGFENKDEHQQVLEKVTSVLPDINRLLEHYQETQGQLSSKDLMAKQTELQHTEEVARLRLELSARKEEYDKLIERLVGDSYKLKTELEEKNKRLAELEEAAKSVQSGQNEMSALKDKAAEAVSMADAARLAKEQLLSDKLKVEADLEGTRKVHDSRHEQHKRDIEDIKRSHREALDAKDKDHQKAASEHKMVLSKVQMELASLITKHSQQKKDLESSRGMQQSLEQKLDAQSKGHEAALAAHKEAIDAKTKEAEDLAAQHRQQLESQLESLTSQRQQELQSVQDAHAQSLKDLRAENEASAAKMLEDHQTAMSLIQGEFDAHKDAFNKLTTDHEEMGNKHTQLVGAVTSWKTRHDEWQAETDKLKGILQTIGQKESSSQSNETYIEAFEALATAVESISKDFFSSFPAGNPLELSETLEMDLPDISGITEAACELRSVTVQHRIFRILNNRIFGRFVFAPLDDHYDADVEGLLSSLSKRIKRKSKRREALWRSITLRALYSDPATKTALSVLASSVLDEIMNDVEALASEGTEEKLREAMKFIVKSSIELWRQCQVEIDSIRSAMLEVEADEDVIFGVRPQIERERIGAPWSWGGDDDGLGQNTVLLQHTVLEKDSSLVRKRRDELEQHLIAI